MSAVLICGDGKHSGCAGYNNGCYWSSEPSPVPNKDEWLEYDLVRSRPHSPPLLLALSAVIAVTHVAYSFFCVSVCCYAGAYQPHFNRYKKGKAKVSAVKSWTTVVHF